MPVLMRFPARLGRQNTQPCGRVWQVCTCPGTRLCHEGRARSLHQMKAVYCPPAISVFLCQGLEMFLCRQNTNQGNLPRLWHWWLACSTALTPCAQTGRPPEEPGVLSTLQKASSGCWEQRCELEGDRCLPSCPFVASATATGTPSCRTPACEATAPTWAATRWALVSVAAWARGCTPRPMRDSV